MTGTTVTVQDTSTMLEISATGLPNTTIELNSLAVEVVTVGIQGPAGPSGATGPIGGLTDVVITSVTNNEVLAYDTSGNWINQTAAEAGLAAAIHTHVEADITDLQPYLLNITGESIGDLSDVNIITPAVRHVLAYDGIDSWDNRLLVEADISDLQAYLTAEVNDLTVAVTWANVPDANITQTSVTQHQAALTITESQISDLGAYLLNIVEDTTPQLGGNLDAQSFIIQNIDQLQSGVVDGATAIAFELDTTNALSTAGSKLLSLKNNAVEKTFVDDDGNISANHIALGAATIDDSRVIFADGDFVAADGGLYHGQWIQLDVSGTVTTPTSQLVASYFYVSDTSVCTTKGTVVAAARFASRLLTSSNKLEQIGFDVQVQNFGTGTADDIYGCEVLGVSLKGVNDSIGMSIGQFGANGNANTDGIRIAKQIGATVNHGIFLNGDGLGSDLCLGAGRDAEIYFDGTDLIFNTVTAGNNIKIGNFEFDADQIVGIGQDNYVLTYDHTTGQISLEVSASGGTTTFLGLTDTPSAYTGAAGQFVKVNATPDALVFSTAALNDLSDVTITAAATGEYLRYSGTAWVDAALDISDDTTPTLGGTLNCSNNDIDNAKTVTFNSEIANTGTTQTINWTSGQKQKSTITAATTMTFTAPAGPCNLLLKIVNGGLGAITWPATVKWRGGTEPSWSSSGTDIATFYYDGTDYYGDGGTAFA